MLLAWGATALASAATEAPALAINVWGGSDLAKWRSMVRMASVLYRGRAADGRPCAGSVVMRCSMAVSLAWVPG